MRDGEVRSNGNMVLVEGGRQDSLETAPSHVIARHAVRILQPAESRPNFARSGLRDVSWSPERPPHGLRDAVKAAASPATESIAKFLRQLFELWQTTPVEECRLLGIDDSNVAYLHALVSGALGIADRDRQDRVAYLLDVRSILNASFMDIDAERAWLRGRTSRLNNKSPLDVMTEGSFEHLLIARDFLRWELDL